MWTEKLTKSRDKQLSYQLKMINVLSELIKKDSIMLYNYSKTKLNYLTFCIAFSNSTEVREMS